MSDYRESYLHDFLEKWPREEVSRMILDSYPLGQEDSFCAWVEYKTEDLGNISGSPGGAGKFGLYKQKNIKDNLLKGFIKDINNYAWNKKRFGSDSAKEAFSKIQKILLHIIDNAQEGIFDNFDDKENVDGLWPMFKWKLAFLYQDFDNIKILPIFSKPKLLECLGVNYEDKGMLELYSMAIEKYNIKTFEDVFAFVDKVFQPMLTDAPVYNCGKITDHRNLPPRTYKGKSCSTIHSNIQKGLSEYLRGQGFKPMIEVFHLKGDRSQIDIVTIKEIKTYYEVKPYGEARMCIREALGQILEYRYYKKSDSYPFADKLVIVGYKKATKEDKCYLDKIRNMHNIPLEYWQFDLETKKVYSW